MGVRRKHLPLSDAEDGGGGSIYLCPMRKMGQWKHLSLSDAEDGVRWMQKKVQWTFFPPNRPTSHLWRGDLEPTGSRGAASWKQKSIPFGMLFLFLGMLFLFLMRKMGLEPTRYCYHRHLKPARLPIPPLPRTAFRIISFLFTNVNRNFNNFETLFHFKLFSICRRRITVCSSRSLYGCISGSCLYTLTIL